MIELTAVEKPSQGLWLNLGSSDDLKPGFLNVDRYFPDAERTKDFDILGCDLNIIPWPWQTDSVDYILAKDIIEHLPNKIVTMNEIWRILKPGGVIHIEVPTTDGRGAFQDPTHVSYWNRNSFFYFESGNPHRERFGDSYGVRARFSILKSQMMQLSDNVIKLVIIMVAVK